MILVQIHSKDFCEKRNAILTEFQFLCWYVLSATWRSPLSRRLLLGVVSWLLSVEYCLAQVRYFAPDEVGGSLSVGDDVMVAVGGVIIGWLDDGLCLNVALCSWDFEAVFLFEVVDGITANAWQE